MIKKTLVCLFIPFALFTGCKSRQADESRPVITVTILPYQYFAEQLTGDHFKINVLVPPGVSHHNYDPTPRQLQELEKSKVLFINGNLGFETGWIPKLRANYKDLTIVNLSAGIDLIADEEGEGGHGSEMMQTADSHGHDHEGIDPHYWMSVVEARKFAKSMAIGLIQADPSCRQMVDQNLNRLIIRLDSLNFALSNRFKNLSHRSFLIFHPALAYLARDYNLIQHSMELGGKEPTASHFKTLVDLAGTEKINTIFIQKEYDQENAMTLARETGAKVITIDPMSPDWLAEMERLAKEIAGMDQR
ncbi:MAG: zinc ABC transporter substrate-binding protein [Bacteroidales bacterium]|jgi:zinc transport system substrate-binding protein